MEQQSYPKRLNVHPNSLMFGHDQRGAQESGSTFLRVLLVCALCFAAPRFHCPWLAYYTIQLRARFGVSRPRIESFGVLSP